MRRSLILILTLGLALAACSSGDEGGEATTTSVAAGSTTEAAVDETTTTEAAPDTTTTVADTTTTTEAPAARGRSSCVEGEWIFGSEGFVEAMREAMTDQDLEASEVGATDGSYIITFAGDGTYTGVRENWGFSVVTPDGTVTVTIDGEETGSWSADDSTISVTVDSSDVQVTAQVEADGQTFTLPNSPVQVPEAITESSPYECDSDTLSVSTEEVTFVLERS